ncbi:MAG: OmpP1/FadL family transporter [Polyangiales bacterium]
MKSKLLTACLLAGLLTPALASANPEPTAYDTRSIGMGLTGTTFMDQPAALALNPANLEGIPKLGFTFNFTNLLVNQTAPVQGPNTSVSSGLGYGPLPSGFIAGRIAPRVVFAGGIYIETGYGSSFSQVECLDGVDLGPNNEANTDPATCANPQAQDLNVTFFVGEFSAGFSFRAHEKFLLGLALRLPFSKQTADLYQNVGAALGTPFYGRVKNDLGGVGYPSLRAGFTIKPHRKVRISAMYRMAAKIKLTGETETALFEGADPLMLQSEADWFIPHAIAFGVSYQANSHLLLAFEARFQFHGAEKSGNKNQTVIASQDGTVLSTVVVPFGWENTWSAKVGFEYRFTKDLLALRLGSNIAKSATSGAFAQYFTPPPGLSGNIAGGLGFYWHDRNDKSIRDKYRLDLAGAFAFTTGNIGNEYIDGPPQPIPGTDQTVQPCSTEQVVRTGCPGDYKVLTYWASLSFTLQY